MFNNTDVDNDVAGIFYAPDSNAHEVKEAEE